MQMTDFTSSDFDGLYEFMRPIWLETYGEFLPKGQILTLLDKYFSKEGIAHYRALGYEYKKLDDAGVLVFCEHDDHVYLDKLYLLPKFRGKGYPVYALNELLKRKKDVLLNVNQHNARALKCYLKNGFTIDKEEIIDLGNGMKNVDYVLRLSANQ